MGMVSLNNLNIVKTAPAEYMNNSGIINEAGKIIASRFGNKVLVSGGVNSLKALENKLFDSLDRNDINWLVNQFSGESSKSNILKLKAKVEKFEATVIIGVGGGKSIDVAKIVADECNIPIVCIPTIAATCAATTPIGIIYNDEGEYKENYYLRTNPNLVLVDPEIILNSPVKYLYSGILDAMAKWYEGSSSITGAQNADFFDIVALQLAETLYKNMIEKAAKAIDSMENNKLTEELIDVINLNIYFAGVIQSLGVKAVRNGIAHAIHNGLTVIHESHNLLHGIKVGYGIIIQLFLLQNKSKEMEDTLSFFREIGFKPSFKNLDLPFDESIIAKVAKKTIHDPLLNEKPFNAITEEMIVSAIKKWETICNI